MGSNVFANSMEVACKAASGKSICAFPDVCMTPPENPATPPGVPIPYPNTGMASDTTGGSRNTSIAGQEVMLKNKSKFKKSVGNEAGCAAKKGVVTSTNRGKVYFVSWSMDVKVEGQNVVRNLDMTTHNHASFPSNTGPWPYIAPGAFTSEVEHPCLVDHLKEETACASYKPHSPDGPDACEDAHLTEKPARRYDLVSQLPDGGIAEDNRDAAVAAYYAESHECLKVRRCFLQTYDSTTKCCPGQTPHHLVEASSFFKAGQGNGRGSGASVPIVGIKTDDEGKYREGKAPCVCAEGVTQNSGSHKMMHTHQSNTNLKHPAGDLQYAGDAGPTRVDHRSTYKQAKENAIEALRIVFPAAECESACIEKQLDNYHNQAGIDDDTLIEACVTGKTDHAAQEYAYRAFGS